MQGSLELGLTEDLTFLESLSLGLEPVVPAGPELMFGKPYDAVGFRGITEELFRTLVVSRLANPWFKLKADHSLRRHCRIEYHVDEVYRFMDRIHATPQAKLEEFSFQHTQSILAGVPQVLFSDMTTPYFQAENDLRNAGYCKDGNNRNLQLVLGLLVAPSGYPLAFQMFAGNTFEGGKMIPVEGGRSRSA